MSTLIKVMAFAISMTLVFTLVANLLPQLEGEAPVDEKIDLGALTMESFIDLGESVFNGKGTCTLCHNDMGRAPNLLVENVVVNANTNMTDARYKGEASDAESYLRESMVNPGIYVVKGFGKKGSNDTESPMPVVTDAPIQLSALEMNAVIAFLQAKDGNEVTVALPTDASAVVAEPEVVQVATTPQEVIAKYTCAACHTVGDTESPVGPSLKTVGARLTANQIRESIVAPAAVIAEGFPPIMPAEVAANMSVKELEMLVAYLAEQK